MDKEFKFSATEFAHMMRISPSALRKRRLTGKLDGQFKKVDNNYFYKYHAKDGPMQGAGTFQVSRRRRNVPRSEVKYHNARNGHQLQLANDIKQMARIQRSLNENQIAEITPDIIEVAKQRRQTRIKEQLQQQKDAKPTKNYGGWLTSHELDRAKFKPTRKEVKIIRTYY